MDSSDGESDSSGGIMEEAERWRSKEKERLGRGKNQAGWKNRWGGGG